jgi:antitoxin component of RelBE/YafQ-DinJ toxin-antitoxin module
MDKVVYLQVKMEEDLKEKLRKEAKSLNISMSDYIRMEVSKILKAKAKEAR